MTDILDYQKIALFFVFAVPGIIALYVRAQFLTGRMPAGANGLIVYVTLTLIYHSVLFPVANQIYVEPPIGHAAWLGWFSVTILLPALLGLLLGLNIRKKWIESLSKKIGLNMVHPIDSAWDWKFSNYREGWVIVKLKDGTRWYGFTGTGSFISTSETERDIFIDQIHDCSGEGATWTPRGSGAWIAHNEIQSIEFLPRATD